MVFGVLLAVAGASVLLTLNRTLWPPDERRRERAPRRSGPARRPAADQQRKAGRPRKPGEVPRITAPARSARSAAATRAATAARTAPRTASREGNSPRVARSGHVNRATHGELPGGGAGARGTGTARGAGAGAGRLRGAP